jgi:hypothetical protein
VIAIAAAIRAMHHRGRRRPATFARVAVRKKTMVAHNTQPPYFTIKAGSPAPSPNLRKARPAAMIARQSQARIIARDRRPPLLVIKPLPFVMSGRRLAGIHGDIA